MSTNNICFDGGIIKISTFFNRKKHLIKSYECSSAVLEKMPFNPFPIVKLWQLWLP